MAVVLRPLSAIAHPRAELGFVRRFRDVLAVAADGRLVDKIEAEIAVCLLREADVAAGEVLPFGAETRIVGAPRMRPEAGRQRAVLIGRCHGLPPPRDVRSAYAPGVSFDISRNAPAAASFPTQPFAARRWNRRCFARHSSLQAGPRTGGGSGWRCQCTWPQA